MSGYFARVWFVAMLIIAAVVIGAAPASGQVPGLFSVAPTSGPPGTTISVGAPSPCSGPPILPPTEPVDVQLVQGPGDNVLVSGEFQANAQGWWSGTLTVPADATPGMATLTAVCNGIYPYRGEPFTITTPGYRLGAGDGGVFAFGLPFEGSPASDSSRCPANPPARSMPNGSCWSMASIPDGGGYWILNAYSGVIYAYGDAVSYGQPADTSVYTGGADKWPNAIGIVSTPDGQGYWVLELGLSGLGSIQNFGDAVNYGDEVTDTAPHIGEPSGMAATPDGKGYWIVDTDGGVFTFGDAGFYGSMGGRALAAPVVGMAATPDGKGYWLVGRDGGVFSFGDAAFGGSMAGTRLAKPVVGMAANPSGSGYWLAAGDGGVFALGGAPFLGSMGGKRIARPVFAISTTPS